MIEMLSLRLKNTKSTHLYGHVKRCVKLSLPLSLYFLDNIYIRFGIKLYRQIVGTSVAVGLAAEYSSCFISVLTLHLYVY